MANTETFLPTIILGTRDFARLDNLATAAETKLPAVATRLGRERERARVVPDHELGPDVVTMGARVVFADDAGEDHDVILVYPEQADIGAGRLSVMTPVGVALIGLSAGQSIQWRTRDDKERTLKVLRVARPS